MCRARFWVGICWKETIRRWSPQHVAEWADVIELEVNPVIEDAAAAEAASGVLGK